MEKQAKISQINHKSEFEKPQEFSKENICQQYIREMKKTTKKSVEFIKNILDFDLNTFNGKDFNKWKCDFLKIINKYDILSYIKEDYSIRDNLTTEENKVNDAVFAVMIFNLEDNILRSINIDHQSPYKLWKTLHELYDDQDDNKLHDAYNSIFENDFDGINIEEFADTFLNNVLIIKKHEIKIDEEVLKYFFLRRLGSYGIQVRELYSNSELELSLLISKVVKEMT